MAYDTASNIWSYAEAKQKCSEKYSCFVEIETQEHITLSPYYIGRIKQGIQEQIEHKIQRWKFRDDYGGIIVAYDHIKLLQRSAEVFDESPLLHFDIKVNYIIFKPEVGKKLIGVVNKTSSSHVGCLVHGRFNASLAKSRSGKNGWIGSDLVIGSEFVFRVGDLRTVAGVLSIAGHIKEKDMKYIKQGNFVSLDDSDSSATQNHGGKNKSLEGNFEETELIQEARTKEKTKRKKYDAQSQNDIKSESGSERNDSSVRKRKKEKSDNK
ncbi:DNA-directed RNA polymerase I subunit RPA43-like isoform X2 [Dendronephthya gigantea]|uniref:DNA-directed RNA polymerase I subunit RPA43-like isoform X2 n=1 Tax=Dendronephthya gigantea TaxID=151771 RepID=UPI001069B1DB|nr:DNA-directed RNA polymerase I subunit RPA43-like isoform X2 [Dendronephthya gigantea]